MIHALTRSRRPSQISWQCRAERIRSPPAQARNRRKKQARESCSRPTHRGELETRIAYPGEDGVVKPKTRATPTIVVQLTPVNDSGRVEAGSVNHFPSFDMGDGMQWPTGARLFLKKNSCAAQAR